MDNLLPLLWTAALLFLVGCITSIVAFVFREKIFPKIHLFFIVSNIKLII